MSIPSPVNATPHDPSLRQLPHRSSTLPASHLSPSRLCYRPIEYLVRLAFHPDCVLAALPSVDQISCSAHTPRLACPRRRGELGSVGMVRGVYTERRQWTYNSHYTERTAVTQPPRSEIIQDDLESTNHSLPNIPHHRGVPSTDIAPEPSGYTPRRVRLRWCAHISWHFCRRSSRLLKSVISACPPFPRFHASS